jgi:hypothetical protein
MKSLRREPVATGAALAVVLAALFSLVPVSAEVRDALVVLATAAITAVVRAKVSPLLEKPGP